MKLHIWIALLNPSNSVLTNGENVGFLVCIHVNDYLKMDNPSGYRNFSFLYLLQFTALPWLKIMDVACFKTGRGKENDERILTIVQGSMSLGFPLKWNDCIDTSIHIPYHLHILFFKSIKSGVFPFWGEMFFILVSISWDFNLSDWELGKKQWSFLGILFHWGREEAVSVFLDDGSEVL